MALLFETRDHVATITFNRPESMNAFNPAQVKEFTDAVIRFGNDPDLWVAILTGAGDRAFSAGADIKELLPVDDGVREPRVDAMFFGNGLDVYKPFIAAVNGYALGGGLEVMLACDIRIASERASFGQPEVALGVTAGWGGSQRLTRQIPWCKAAELLLTGQRIDAREAHRIGLVNKVVPHEELMAEANRWADVICKQGPVAVRATKEAMLRGYDVPLAAGLFIEQQMFGKARRTEDADEAIAAFAEKRPPVFRNR
jgi:enoyl-CoA hydratase/carnithine racemase